MHAHRFSCPAEQSRAAQSRGWMLNSKELIVKGVVCKCVCVCVPFTLYAFLSFSWVQRRWIEVTWMMDWLMPAVWEMPRQTQQHPVHSTWKIFACMCGCVRINEWYWHKWWHTDVVLLGSVGGGAGDDVAWCLFYNVCSQHFIHKI